MAVRWVTIASLAVVFFIGAVATLNPTVSIATTALCILAVIVLTRFRPDHWVHSTVAMPPDWIVVLLPTAVAIRLFSSKASLVIIGLLVAAAFMRKPDGRFRIESGPLLLLIASSAIVFSRPAEYGPPLIFLLVGTLVLRLVVTVDGRKIIASLIDGCGLYLLANVVAHAAGLQSAALYAGNGIGAESTGFVRTVYPLASSINIPPIGAAVYIAACSFLILEDRKSVV